MRDILFRGKRIDNGEWVEGDICRSAQQIYIHPNHNSFRVTKAGLSKFLVMHDINPDTIGQYTGLTDKNGRKIFEGDILREPAKIEWEKKNFVGFEVFWHDNDSCDRHIGWQMNRLHFYGSLCGADIYPIAFRPEWTSRMGVIGNIHDNPELMEEH